MPTGTIKKIIKNFGYIQQDEGGDDVHFYINWVKEVDTSQVVEGLRVEYEARRTSKGLQTKWVRALKTYRFLNPYNFVRFLNQSRPNNDVLGDCPPPPHDRYVGLTGRITCEVEAITPLFVSDSHGIEPHPTEDKHKIYRFFKYLNEKGELEPALPASSLRGMVRSVFEAVTNSCLGVFEDKTLSEHFDSGKAPWLIPARVEKNGNEWRLRLLTGTSKLAVGSEPEDKQYAAWLHRYWPIQPSKTLTKTKGINYKTRLFQERTDSGTEIDISPFHHGDKCFALLQEAEHPHPRIKFWDVVMVNSDKAVLEGERQKRLRRQYGRRKRPQLIVREGWLCINNQNIEAKHSERFFFRDSSNKTGPELINLPKPVRSVYENLIADYQDRHKATVKKRQENLSLPIRNQKGNMDSALSRFIFEDNEKTLEGGELVYAFLEEDSDINNPEVKFIAPVSVPRVGYEQSIGDLLFSYLHHCKFYEELCPACRTFGWVADKKAEGQSACAGRVRFTHGKLSHNAGTLGETTLAILSSPKPTTTLFYLLNQDGNPADVDYNSHNAQLRGRKVYRHHGKQLREKEYKRNPNGEQNRTVRGALKAGAKFTFTLDFENLADVELGALLWALELGEGMHHRLGYAKPLGFGSVAVTVTGLKLMQPQQRYTSFSVDKFDDGWQDELDQKNTWKDKFTKAMTDLYGRDFYKLDSIKDLCCLLGEPPELPIHYPRSERKPSEEEKNYEWFVGNKNRPNKQKKPSIPLPLPGKKEKDGLPLLDKDGREVS